MLTQRLVSVLGASVLTTGVMACSAAHSAAPVASRHAPAASAGVVARDVTTYHGDNGRSGEESAAPLGRLARGWARSLGAAVYGQPLVLTVNGVRTVVVATERNVVYGLNPATGAVRWHTRSLGTPVRASQLPCGNIDPLGITGTPVYEARSRAVWVVAEVSDSHRHVHHVLAAVNPANGRVIVTRNADPAGQDPTVEQQRGALLAENHTIYIAYGGLSGDCGQYHGYVVSIAARGGRKASFQTPSAREAGIWAPPGPVADAAGHLYVAVGNGASTGGAWDRSDSVLELSPGLRLIGAFAPASWARDNASDLDLGSTGPTLLPNGTVYADGKSPYAYTVRAGHLRGVGSELARAVVCASYGGTAHHGNTVFVPCTDGIRAVAVAANGHLAVRWHAPSSVAGSPVVSGQTVFALDQSNGTLVALAIGTGRVRASIGVGAVPRFATPALSGSQAFIGTMTGVVAVNGV